MARRRESQRSRSAAEIADGVVNVLPAMPSNVLDGMTKVEVRNYATWRARGMLNVPLTAHAMHG
jgi:hypothetical protein